MSLASFVVALGLVELAARLFVSADAGGGGPRYFLRGKTKTEWSPPAALLQPVRVGDVYPDHPQGEEVIYLQHPPRFSYAHEYPSNPRGYFDSENRVYYKTNSHGFRGPDLSPEVEVPGKENREIVVLGDSFTFGEGVRVEDTYVSLLEKAVRSANPGSNLRAFNFAQPGLDTSAELLLWLKHKALVHPDLVMLAFIPNDAVASPEQAIEKRRIDESYLRLFEPPAGLARYSRLYRIARERIIRKELSSALVDVMVNDLHRKSGEGPSPWERCALQLTQLRDDVRSSGAAFMVVVIPLMEKLNHGYPYGPIHESVTAFCRENGVPVLDLLPVFEGRREEELWVHPVDHHPNDIAQRIIAEAIAADPQFNRLISQPPRAGE